MIESYPLITTIVISVVSAFLLGLLANLLHLTNNFGLLASRRFTWAQHSRIYCR